MAITETIEENLAHKVFDKWQQSSQGKYWTYIEVLHLAENFVKICREQGRDCAEFDFPNILDKTLTYYENLDLISVNLGATTEAKEDKENYAKWLDEVKPQEAEKLEAKNNTLTLKLDRTIEDLKIEQAKREHAEQELKELKQRQQVQLAENFLAPPPPPEPVKVKATKRQKLRACKDFLSDLYWVIRPA